MLEKIKIINNLLNATTISLDYRDISARTNNLNRNIKSD